MWREIYWGYYRVNLRSGVVQRNKPGMGTWVGRELKPYYPSGAPHTQAYISFHVKGRRYQRTYDSLFYGTS